MTLTRTEVRDLLDRYQISPKRSLGQNFVVEPNTVRRIAELAEIDVGDQVLEIGPGLGSLTLALEDLGAHITALEIDDKLVEVLKEVTDGKRVNILHEDAMKFDFGTHTSGGRWKLVANLPYNISVPLICNVLDTSSSITEMLVMVQSEVADRLVARPKTKAYGFPSLKVSFSLPCLSNTSLALSSALAISLRLSSKPPTKTSLSDLPAADLAFSMAFKVSCNS